jgi:hypothetical protein
MRPRLLLAGVLAAASLAAPAQALAEIRAAGRVERVNEARVRVVIQNTGDEVWRNVRFTGRAGHTFSGAAPSQAAECGTSPSGAGPTILCTVLEGVGPGQTFTIEFSSEPVYPDGAGGHLIVQASFSDTRTFEVDLTGPGEPPPELPQQEPEAGRSEVVEPLSGTVRIRVRGSRRFVVLRAGQVVPDRSELDTRRGVARVTVAANRAGTATSSIDVSEGIALIDQKASLLTELKLTERLSCPRASRATTSQRRRKKRRRLFTDTDGGKFRTRGNWAAATAGGTAWRTIDTCTSTKIQVTEGTVEVRDRAARRTVDVTAPESYTARRSRAARSSR